MNNFLRRRTETERIKSLPLKRLRLQIAMLKGWELWTVKDYPFIYPFPKGILSKLDETQWTRYTDPVIREDHIVVWQTDQPNWPEIAADAWKLVTETWNFPESNCLMNLNYSLGCEKGSWNNFSYQVELRMIEKHDHLVIDGDTPAVAISRAYVLWAWEVRVNLGTITEIKE